MKCLRLICIIAFVLASECLAGKPFWHFFKKQKLTPKELLEKEIEKYEKQKIEENEKYGKFDDKSREIGKKLNDILIDEKKTVLNENNEAFTTLGEEKNGVCKFVKRHYKIFNCKN